MRGTEGCQGSQEGWQASFFLFAFYFLSFSLSLSFFFFFFFIHFFSFAFHSLTFYLFFGFFFYVYTPMIPILVANILVSFSFFFNSCFCSHFWATTHFNGRTMTTKGPMDPLPPLLSPPSI